MFVFAPRTMSARSCCSVSFPVVRFNPLVALQLRDDRQKRPDDATISMATEHAIAALNTELARHAMPAGVDLDLSCAEQQRSLRLCSVEGRLVVSAATADGAAPTTAIEFATADAARRLVIGGKSAAISLLASGELRVQGNVLGQLNVVQEALASLDTASVQRLHTLCHALLSEYEAHLPSAAAWVLDRDATRCMSASCGAPFTLTRRRHHCRTCGEVFCSRCAPRPALGLAKRICGPCSSGAVDGPAPRPPASASAATMRPPDAPLTAAAEWLLEHHVETELQRIAWRARALGLLATALAVGVLAAAAWYGGPRLQLALVAACALYLAARAWLRRYAAVAQVCLVLGLSVLATHLQASGRSAPARAALWELAHRVNARYVFDSVAQLGQP